MERSKCASDGEQKFRAEIEEREAVSASHRRLEKVRASVRGCGGAIIETYKRGSDMEDYKTHFLIK